MKIGAFLFLEFDMLRMMQMILSVFRSHADDNFKVPVEKRRCIWDLEKEC
jgi:hypothetical protein